MFQFQEILEHVIKLGGFSATMESVLQDLKCAILVMTGDNSDESRATSPFCGGCARFFFSFPKNILCRPTREISFKINCLLITYDILLDMMYVKLYHMAYLEKWNKTGISFHKNQSK